MNVKAMFQRDAQQPRPALREVEPQPFAPTRRKWSERAAEIEEYVEGLEAQVVRLQDESRAWERAASLVEGERDRLRAENALEISRLQDELQREKSERERLTAVITALDAEFVMLANGIVASMEKVRGSAARYAPKPETMRQLAREIDGSAEPIESMDDDPAPAVVTQGPVIP